MSKHKTYVTFGFEHAHAVNGKTFDKDCVALIYASDAADGRDKAFEYFGTKFCFEYPESNFEHDKMIKYFPRGIIEVNPEANIVQEGLVEGETCNRDGCSGTMKEVPSDGGCSCHISPPCSYCTNKEYECDHCGHLEGAF